MILDNFGIVGFLFFGRIPVDSSHFSALHFDCILGPKYFILKLLKRSFNPNVRTNWRGVYQNSVRDFWDFENPLGFFSRFCGDFFIRAVIL